MKKLNKILCLIASLVMFIDFTVFANTGSPLGSYPIEYRPDGNIDIIVNYTHKGIQYETCYKNVSAGLNFLAILYIELSKEILNQCERLNITNIHNVFFAETAEEELEGCPEDIAEILINYFERCLYNTKYSHRNIMNCLNLVDAFMQEHPSEYTPSDNISAEEYGLYHRFLIGLYEVLLGINN